MDKKNRSFGLDIVRFWAITLVMINHSGPFLPEFKSKWHIEFLSGFLGVELFFCLSGFLIGTILIKVINGNHTGIKDLLSFWVKRWFRTIPIYWVCLVLYAACFWYFRYPEFGTITNLHFLRYFVFIQNLFYYHPPFFEVSWSLCIEEWFYLIFPVVLFILLKCRLSRKSAVLLTVGVIISAAFIFRLWLYFHLLHSPEASSYSWDLGIRKIVIFRLDATVYGVMLAFVNYYYRETLFKFKKILTWTGACLFGLGCIFFGVFAEQNIFNFCSVVLLFPMVNLGFSMLLVNFFDIEKSRRFPRISNLIERISLISYSIYLLHFTIWAFFYHFFTPAFSPIVKVAFFAAFWLVTYFTSVLTYTYIEQPVLRLRDKWTK
jgi:peptidoglycan/LPS O-acetylase OafA/YrhL